MEPSSAGREPGLPDTGPASRPLRIGIVAGEVSGDLLAAGLIRAIRALEPDAVIEGVVGPQMAAAGCRGLGSIESLSVMGLSEVVAQLPRLVRLRRSLKAHFRRHPPDLFIGVDAPDFNLGLERALRHAGVRTVHLVSPSVWAWRRYRIHRIRRSVDLMLVMLPFEEGIYREHQVPVAFIGHPLADRIPAMADRAAARQRLGLAAEGPLIALLPGSRIREVQQLARPFLATARWCLARRPDVHFVVPCANAAARARFEADMPATALGQMTLLDGHSHAALAAADVALLASGTATLEALLFRRPMVVAYRVSGLSYRLLRRLVRLPYYSLPNLLAGRRIVPEFIQGEVRPERMGPALLELLDAGSGNSALMEAFADVSRNLRRDADGRAARCVIELARR